MYIMSSLVLIKMPPYGSFLAPPLCIRVKKVTNVVVTLWHFQYNKESASLEM
jgi:hypothetical protein